MKVRVLQGRQNIHPSIIKIINNKWNKHINEELIEAIWLFNLEQNFKYNKQTLEFIITWGKKYLLTYKLIKNDNNDPEIDNILEETIKLQLNEFILRHNEFSSINSENENLKKNIIKKINITILNFYGIYLYLHITN